MMILDTQFYKRDERAESMSPKTSSRPLFAGPHQSGIEVKIIAEDDDVQRPNAELHLHRVHYLSSPNGAFAILHIVISRSSKS
jgi:hypothetical protein